MPVAVSYPGVYIDEIPSGVRTIVGVATSITAFVGRAPRGPVNDPVTINSFGDFERAFGGLQKDYPMSYAVSDFYQNGGSQAIIVRLIHPNFATDAERDTAVKDALNAAQEVVTAIKENDVAKANKAAADKNTEIQQDNNKSQAAKAAAQAVADAVGKAAGLSEATVDSLKQAATQAASKAAANAGIPGKAKLRLETNAAKEVLVLEAASEGAWGNSLGAHIDYEGIKDKVGDRYKAFGLTEEDLFNLTITDLDTRVSEQFLNLTIKPNNPRGVDNVLKQHSNLACVQLPLPSSKPKDTDEVLLITKLIEQFHLSAEINTVEQIKEELQQIIKTGKGEGAKEEQKKNGTEAQKVVDSKVLDSKAPPFNPGNLDRYIRVTESDQGSDGGDLDQNDITLGAGLQANKRGLYALDKVDLFNLLCIPPSSFELNDIADGVYRDALNYCVARRAVLIVDSPSKWSANKDTAATNAKNGLPSLGLSGEAARNAALYFPRVREADPLREGQINTFVPCGVIAGVMARTDVNRGIWKAPAGLDATLSGIQGLDVTLNDAENGMLNPLGINCLRVFPINGRVVWGARTLRGADQLADEYKYIPVRRTALFIEESLYRGTQWVVFEPNDEPLWAQIRLNIGAFMQNLFRQGAFQGKTPREAYFVKCDKETTTQNDINLGIVNIVVGFAPLKPAEFVIVKIQQMAGQIEV